MSKTKSLVTAVAELNDRGYTHEFRIKNKQLYSDELKIGFGMEAFTIDDAYAFSVDEGGDEEGNTLERLFAIMLIDKKIKGFW